MNKLVPSNAPGHPTPIKVFTALLPKLEGTYTPVVLSKI